MAEQFVAVLWLAQRNYESGVPFMVGQLSLVQRSFREVAKRLSSRTNWRTCSYFQMFVSTLGGFSMILSMFAESLPGWGHRYG